MQLQQSKRRVPRSRRPRRGRASRGNKTELRGPEPTLLALATATPKRVIEQAETLSAIHRMFGEHHPEALLARFVTSSGVRKRHLVTSPEWLIAQASLGERTRAYQESVLTLAESVLRGCLQNGTAQAAPSLLISTSCTGFMLPSMEAYLINRLALSPTTRRLPLTELGCSAAATGLALAAQFVDGAPGRRAAVVSVETPSLTLKTDDFSTANVVSSVLFGDGAAAALIGSSTAGGLKITGSATELIAGTEDCLGFSLESTGFATILSNRLPGLLRRHLAGAVRRALETFNVAADQLRFYVVHPGGPRILEVVREALGLERSHLAASYAVLEEFGNLSSASLFFVLRHLLDHAPPEPGARGLMLGIGPGLSIETVCLRWSSEGG